MSTRDAKMKNLRLKLETLFESYDKKSKSTSPSAEPREMDQQNVCGGPKGTFENYGVSLLFRFFFKLILKLEIVFNFFLNTTGFFCISQK